MSKELIKITTNEQGKKLVSARELHEFLESKERFSKWWTKVSSEDDYGFVNGVDYTPYQTVHPQNNQEITDYIVTVEMGKEISMISKLPKGKEARKYFIECEKQLLEVSKKALLLEQIYNGGQEGILASKQLTELEVKEATKELNEKIEQDKPLVEFGNQILKSKDNILIRELAKIISDEVTKIGQNRLYDKLREWKMIMKNSTEPYQSYVENGYFVVEEKSINTAYSTRLTKTTKCTPKGQVAIVEKFRKEFNKTNSK